MKVPDAIVSLVRQNDCFVLASHINPDGDALGSSIALSMALEHLGKKTVVYNKDRVPEFYRFLPGHERFTNSISNFKSQISNLILLDCNSIDRTEIKDISVSHAAVIDHHETEDDFGDIRWVERSAAATGIMVYHLIRELGVPLTKEIAVNLYTAIAIDTGTFRYSNTTSGVLKICSELIDAGAEPHHISESLYETWSSKRFMLLVLMLNTMEKSGPVAITTVTRQMFEDTGTSDEDTENFSNFPRMMKDVRLSALFREIGDDYWKASLRSKGDVNVAAIAESFGGGGHRNAAGYRIRADIKTAKEELIKAVMDLKQAESSKG